MQSENLAHSRIGMLWQLGHSFVHTFLRAESRENRTFLTADIFVVLLQKISTVLALGCVLCGSVVFIIRFRIDSSIRFTQLQSTTFVRIKVRPVQPQRAGFVSLKED